MTTPNEDIVARIRRWAPREYDFAREMFLLAADEIERLRAENAERDGALRYVSKALTKALDQRSLLVAIAEAADRIVCGRQDHVLIPHDRSNCRQCMVDMAIAAYRSAYPSQGEVKP